MVIKIDSSKVSDYLLQNEVSEPIVVKRQGVPHAVMIPYENFQVRRRENQRVVRVDELTVEEIEGIINSKPSAKSDKYNGDY